MNNPHKNARLTATGRAVMVRRVIEEGQAVAVVAAGFGTSERTVRKWVLRYLQEGPAGLENRSSRPHRSPRSWQRRVSTRLLDCVAITASPGKQSLPRCHWRVRQWPCG